MEENKPQDNQSNPTEENSLEGGASEVKVEQTSEKSTKKQGAGGKIRGLIAHVNIYILAFIFILVLAGGLVLVSIQRNKKTDSGSTINTQTLTADELRKLSEKEQKVGDPKSVLTIESNTIFNGKVLVRDSLDVAGTIKVGGSLSLPGISVSGQSSFDQIRANNLSISGNVAVNGQLNIQKGITSSGGATFGGPVSVPTLTVQNLQLAGDLQITRHIDAGGGTPGKSDGAALGGGGTSSVSGTDTAGTVNINTGGGSGAGCYITVNFTQRFNGTPHVVITPASYDAGGINYYISRSSSNFSICSRDAAGGGRTLTFDYIVID